MKNKKFSEWSAAWKKLRVFSSENLIDGVLSMWKVPPPIKGLRVTWEMLEGFRKKTSEAGEKKVERLLLGDQEKKSIIVRKGRESIELVTIYQNFATAQVKRGQVIADCFGLIRVKQVEHPIAIEVKVGANDPWYAAVENLQQIKLMRSNVKNIGNSFAEKGASAKGAWGMIVAPKDYYKKATYRQSCMLLDRINTKKTEARIMFVSYSLTDLENGFLDFQYGYWPV